MKTLLTGLILGIFGAIAVYISLLLHWPTWVMFIAWVSYYLFGKTLKNSLGVFIQMIMGIVMGLLIQITGIWLSGIAGVPGLPLAVFFFIGSLAWLSRVKGLNSIPAWFMGLIIFFGVHPAIAPRPLFSLLIPIVSGFLFAWLNDAAIQQLASRKRKTASQ